MVDRPPRDERGIALVGHSMRTQDQAPFAERSRWIIFGLGSVHSYIPRANLWIEMHTPEQVAVEVTMMDKDKAWYQTAEIPIYCQRHFPEWPTSIPLPLDKLRARFPRVPWNGTVIYMLAISIMLIEQGLYAPRIGMWGFDMLDPYGGQEAGFAYLVGLAEQSGIEVHYPENGALFRQPFLYGFEDEKASQRREQLAARGAELDACIVRMQEELKRIDSVREDGWNRFQQSLGAKSENEYQRRFFSTPEPEAAIEPSQREKVISMLRPMQGHEPYGKCGCSSPEQHAREMGDSARDERRDTIA